MVNSSLARRLGPPLAVLALLLPAATAQSASETGTFSFTESISDTLDLSATCLATTGTLTGTDTVNGRFTENGPPAFGFHFHGSGTVEYRVDLADGRYVLGTSIEHFDGNAIDTEHVEETEDHAVVGQYIDSHVSRDTGTLYGADGQVLGTVVVHDNGHLIWRDLDADHEPDPGEIRSELDNFRLTCR